MDHLLLIRYGEIGLKGKNRHLFEEQLMRNIRAALGDALPGRVQRAYGRIFVELGDSAHTRAALERLQKVFGIVAVSPALRVPLTVEAVEEGAVELVRRLGPAGARTFRVQARRPNKAFPLTSQEINERIGALLLRTYPQLKVDLHQPELVVSIEVREQGAYLYSEQTPGPGGLPVGVSSHALLLLSGGIDSPVAGWMAMKRGIRLDAIHFHSPPFTSERALDKVKDLTGVLASWGGPIRLHVVRFTEIQKELRRQAPAELMITLMRRFMLRIAVAVAQDVGALALVTGESVGQVASQTLENMSVINAVTSMPILRPLVGFDKQEIVERAQAIGTYSISIRPYEDCCTIFVPAHPATRPQLAEVEAAEAALDVAGLVREALASIETTTLAEAPAGAG
ncbi:MAG: tRNA 4-thiouridine(8) synthase ThiI [Firmicutes bacterium ZCTH02-B6]|nr:MAG: tRNA 4-thiouridine(8) synthase ThiI [Firmicutes bacterium ZCTH02-B6]